jgi:hypothetical protein
MSLAIVFAGLLIANAIDPESLDFLVRVMDEHPLWTIAFMVYILWNTGGSSTTVRNIIEKGKDKVK